MNLNLLKYPLSILLLVGCFLQLIAQSQDIPLHGSVVVQNSKTLTGKTEYLANVNVKSFKATPKISDARGLFKLVFSSVNFGAKTEIRADKTGYVVINEEVLKEAVIIGRTDTLKIVMCDKAQFEDNKQRFYNISTDNLQRELSRRVTKLQRANAQDKRRLIDSLQNEMNLKLASADEAIAQLNARSKALEEQLERITIEFATVNLDDASDAYRLAYTAFAKGEVNEALMILNAIDLKKKLAESVRQISRRDTLIKTMQRQNDTERIHITQYIQACLLAANSHILLYQHREAQTWYETAIDYADTTNLTLLNDYTAYLYEFGEYLKAAQINSIALNRAERLRQTVDSSFYTEGYAIALYYHVLLLSRQASEPQLTQNACLAALPLFEQLAHTDTLKHLMRGQLMSELAQSYGVLKTKKGDSLSLVWYKNALIILRQPVAPRFQNNLLLYTSTAHLGLGNTYRYVKKLDSSKVHCLLSIELRQQLFQRDSSRYAPYLALAHTMFAAALNVEKEYDKAIESLSKAVHYSSISRANNPQYSRKELMRSQFEWVRSLRGKKQFDAAETILDSLEGNLMGYKMLFSDEWVVVLMSDFVRVKRSLIADYFKLRQWEKARQKSLKTYEFLPNNDYTSTTYAVALLFTNNYNEAIRILETITEERQIVVKTALEYFEEQGIQHRDFGRVRTHFGIAN
jgi:hypothetical protein